MLSAFPHGYRLSEADQVRMEMRIISSVMILYEDLRDVSITLTMDEVEFPC